MDLACQLTKRSPLSHRVSKYPVPREQIGKAVLSYPSSNYCTEDLKGESPDICWVLVLGHILSMGKT